MTRDSMLGLLAGVAGVVLIAVVYHQKNGTEEPPKPTTAPVNTPVDYPTPAAATPVVQVR